MLNSNLVIMSEPSGDLEIVQAYLVSSGANPEVIEALKKATLADRLNATLLSQTGFNGILNRTIQEYISGTLTINHDRRKDSQGVDEDERKGDDRRSRIIKVDSDMVASAMTDVARFKYYNDTFGERVGDLILVAVGDLFNEALRPYDASRSPIDYESFLRDLQEGVAGRDKGDEYRLMLIGSRPRDALERILKNVQEDTISRVVKKVEEDRRLYGLFKGKTYDEQAANLENLANTQESLPVRLTAGYVTLKDIEDELKGKPEEIDPTFLTARMILRSTTVLEAGKMEGEKGRVYSFKDLVEGRITGSVDSIPPSLVGPIHRLGAEVVTRNALRILERDHPEAYALIMSKSS